MSRLVTLGLGGVKSLLVTLGLGQHASGIGAVAVSDAARYAVAVSDAGDTNS